MKSNKVKKIITIALVLVLLSGCTKYMSDDDNKGIVYKKTGQRITSNILCRPTDPELLKIYEDNPEKIDIALKDLPECKNFKPGDIKYVGIWELIFVKPLAWLIISLGNLIKNYGLSVMLVGLLIRLILIPLTKKNMAQSKKMGTAQIELKKIEKKYKDKKDQESTMAKSQETVAIYQKHGINPVSGCLFSVIQLPLFFAFLEAINRVPAIFEGHLLSLQLGTTPLIGINKGNYLYIVLILLIILSTFFSLKNAAITPGSSPEQQKQTKYMQIFMLGFFSIASLNLPTAVGLYWIVTNSVTAVQNIAFKKEK